MWFRIVAYDWSRLYLALCKTVDYRVETIYETTKESMMDYYGTYGPSCSTIEVIDQLAKSGMTGLRYNISHASLASTADFCRELNAYCKATHRSLKQVIDLCGPEVRIGVMPESMMLEEGDVLLLGESVPVQGEVLEALEVGDVVLLDDGKIEGVTVESHKTCAALKITIGGLLHSRKSLKIRGKLVNLPVVNPSDRESLVLAKALGITGVMQPFARRGEDLIRLRSELTRLGLGELKVLAKVENRDGVEALADLLPHCDEVVIARGDLGNDVPLWELPSIQKRVARVCRDNGVPFMVVTQLLDSMITRPKPTRAELSDVYNGVLDGCASLMLTGETANGAYPVEAITYLVKTAEVAIVDRKGGRL